LGYAELGEVLFVVTLTETQFTSEMTNLGAIFEIFGDGGSGADANPEDNVFEAHLGVPNLVITWIHVDPAVFNGGRGGVWVYLRNTGTVTACGLYGGGECNGFPLDLFFDPDPLPRSYPSNEFGDCYRNVAQIVPGGIAGPKFTFVPGEASDGGLCKMTKVTDIWAKVDNWKPGYGGFPAEFGFIPESNEDDNLFQYLRPYILYLPFVFRNSAGP
jgi:hypothetical protein